MAARAAIFDLDGTLWDSMPWYATVAARGVDAAVDQILITLQAGRPAATVLRRAGLTRKAFAHICEAKDPPLRPFPGTRSALDDLQEAGFALAVVTNLPSWIAIPMLAATELKSVFQTVVDFAATSRHKPAPAPLLEAARRLRADPAVCWYVGDTETDSTAAQSAGMHFAWAAWGAACDPPPDVLHVVRSPKQLAHLILGAAHA